MRQRASQKDCCDNNTLSDGGTTYCCTTARRRRLRARKCHSAGYTGIISCHIRRRVPQPRSDSLFLMLAARTPYNTCITELRPPLFLSSWIGYRRPATNHSSNLFAPGGSLQYRHTTNLVVTKVPSNPLTQSLTPHPPRGAGTINV